MKKHWKVLTGLVLCMTLMIGMVVTGHFKSPLHLFHTQKYNQEAAAGTYTFPSSYNSKKHLVVLEVVPDYSYAQLSYGMKGAEPIDMMAACQNGDAEKVKSLFGDDMFTTYSPGSKISEDMYEEILSQYFNNNTEKAAKYITGPSVSAGSKFYQFIGTDGKVSDETFLVSNNVLDTCLSEVLGTKFSSTKVYSITADELNQADLDELDAFLDDVDVVFFNQNYIPEKEDVQKKLVKEYGLNGHKGDSITENATFLSKDLDWDVVQHIFTKVGSKASPLTMVMDRSIYDDALAANLATVTTHQYSVNRGAKYENNKPKSSYDLIGSNGLFDETNYTAGEGKVASSNNVYKLFLMSMFRDPAEFYNIFVESGLIQDKNSGAVGSYQLQSDETAKTDWNNYTFLPCKGDLAGEDIEAANTDYWTDKMSIRLSLPSNDYVNCNVASIRMGNQNIFQVFAESQTFDWYTNKQENSKLQHVIKELYAYKPKARVDGKAYQVLDIEPANSRNVYSLEAVNIERIIPYMTYSKKSNIALTIKRMATAEFNSNITDLISTYDMIYIGNDISGMNTTKDENGNVITFYGKKGNDKDSYNYDKRGVIYAHVGGAVQFKNGSGFTLKSGLNGEANGYNFYAAEKDSNNRLNYGRLCFSGNDITNRKSKEIVNYILTGLPVTVAEGLLNDANNDGGSQYFDDYSNNNMRKLLRAQKTQFIDLGYNYRTAYNADNSGLLDKLTMNKPTMQVDSIVYNSYAGQESVSGANLTKNYVYKFLSTSSNRRLTFNYRVNNIDNTSAKFTAQLYVDKNADGLFKDTEKIGSSQTVTADGTGRTISFNMNTNYRGAFSWKLELTSKENSNVKISQVGYGTIRLTNLAGASTKRTVKVLQVQAIKGENNDNHRDHATSWGLEKAQQVKLTDLIGTLEDFDINISLTTLDKFAKNYSLKKMMNYDMIVFGFADSYRDLDMNKDCAGNVESYIRAGKSVLFTHDLTSKLNDDNSFSTDDSSENGTGRFAETTNGKCFNKYLRDAMGLNRFNLPLRVSGEAFSSAYDATSQVGKYQETMGFTYACLMQYSNAKKTSNGGSDDTYLGPYKYLHVNFNSSNPPWPDINKGLLTHYVTNINDGQITKYPFDLSEEKSDMVTRKNIAKENETRYKIADTHGQYYQVNLEDEDVVCWYALSDNSGDSTWNDKGWYSASPNDAANNYYIYSKGNVSYSGVGHSKTGAMTTFEKKLFINTMVAALRAGVEGPTINITNGYNVPDETTGESRQVVYAEVDGDSDPTDFDKTENVKFYVTDDSADDGDTNPMYVTLEVYDSEKDAYVDVTNDSDYKMFDSSGNAISSISKTFTYKDESNNKQEITRKVIKVKRTGSTVDATSRILYTLHYPRKILETQNSQNFRLTVYNGEYARGEDNGAIMRMAIFKLD
ncbi:MAG: DUF5057 domain-containing protein [Lachnospiraceae bacterium]|nr:DUF5057 domain-containing protein [Lachnospiraceae bacterium]